MEAKFSRLTNAGFYRIGCAVSINLSGPWLTTTECWAFWVGNIYNRLYAFHYVDRQEKSARERQLKEELLAVEKEMPPEELPSASDLSLVFIQVDDYDEVFRGACGPRPLLVVQLINSCGMGGFGQGLSAQRWQGPLFNASSYRELESQESNNFPILDEIRKIDYGNRVPVTLSVGATKGVDPQNRPNRVNWPSRP